MWVCEYTTSVAGSSVCVGDTPCYSILRYEIGENYMDAKFGGEEADMAESQM